MINARVLLHNGAIELTAMVRDSLDWAVWIEHAMYYDYSIDEARELFRQHMANKGYILLDDITV